MYGRSMKLLIFSLTQVTIFFSLCCSATELVDDRSLSIDLNTDQNYGVKVYVSETTFSINIKIKVAKKFNERNFLNYNFGIKNKGGLHNLPETLPVVILSANGCVTETLVEQFVVMVIPEMIEYIGVDLNFVNDDGVMISVNLDILSYINKYREQDAAEKAQSQISGVGGKFNLDIDEFFENEFDCI